MKTKKSHGIETIKKRYGMAFVAPWVFGVIVFVLVPLITSLVYSLSTVTIGSNGLETDFAGIKHYRNLLFSDANYTDLLVKSITDIFTSLPIIIALSLIFAIILNQQFRGRMLMRAVFFLPVIFASDVVMSVMSGDTSSASLSATLNDMSGSNMAYMNAVDFSEILQRLNLPAELNNLMEEYLQETFNIIWSCGVQTLLFIAGLQTISKQLYEVGKVEGATAWESFWYITIPMLSNVTMLVIFYTMIELFITKGELVITALNDMRIYAIYDTTSAMLWLYFLVVGIVIGVIFLLYKQLIQKRIN